MAEEHGLNHMTPAHDDREKLQGTDMNKKEQGTAPSSPTPCIEYGPAPEGTKAVFDKRKTVAFIVAVCLLFSAMTGLGGIFFGRWLGTANDSGADVSIPRAAGGLGSGERVLMQKADDTDKTNLVGTYAEVYRKCADSVVEILAQNKAYTSGVSMGSGVVIGKGEDSGYAYVITNNHVVEEYESILARTASGDECRAEVIGADWLSDIAVLRVESMTLPAAVFGDSDRLTAGEAVAAIGNPLGKLGGSITDGILSGLSRNITVEGVPMTLLQTTAAINPGNSGGGLFDMAGNLIGVVNAKSAGSSIDGIGYAIPINTALKKATEIIEQGYALGVPDLGLTVTEGVSGGLLIAKDYAYNSELGENSIAAGDVLCAINGQKTTTLAEYRGALVSLLTDGKMQETAEVRIARRGQYPRVITLTLRVREFTPSSGGERENVAFSIG